MFSIYRIICGLCIITVLVFGCDTFYRQENKTVIVVGSRHVTADELKRDMLYVSAGIDVRHRNHKQVRERLVDQLIDHYLIMEYGKKNNITLSEKEIQVAFDGISKGYTEDAFQDALLRGYIDLEQWKDRLKEQLLVNKIIGNISEKILLPSYKEIKLYYKENHDEFRFPKMVEFRQIVTKTKEEARNLLKRLKNGEEMSSLAEKYSIAPEAEKGGKVGWVEHGSLDASMEKVLFSLPVGRESSVIKTPYGYHIFEVLAIRSEGVKALRDVITEIESKILGKRREMACKKWLEGLRRSIAVKINKELLNSMELS